MIDLALNNKQYEGSTLLLIVVIVAMIFILIFQLLNWGWNWLAPEFGLPKLDFWQTTVLFFVTSALFKGGNSLNSRKS